MGWTTIQSAGDMDAFTIESADGTGECLLSRYTDGRYPQARQTGQAPYAILRTSALSLLMHRPAHCRRESTWQSCTRALRGRLWRLPHILSSWSRTTYSNACGAFQRPLACLLGNRVAHSGTRVGLARLALTGENVPMRIARMHRCETLPRHFRVSRPFRRYYG